VKLAIDGGKPLLKKALFPIVPGKEEISSVVSTMKKGYLSSFEGKNTVAEFENKFAKYNNSKNAVAYNTGTSAIHAAVACMNAKREGEVIVPAMTFITSVTPMLIEGLRPVFVDISDKDLGMDPSKIKEEINENTVGILPTHLLGFPCEIQKINKIAKENNLFLIEDCAQAHGASVNGKKVGTFGDAGCFSFYLTKNMTTGEGGMVVTDNDNLVRDLKTMRQCGKSDPSTNMFSRLAFNYRMSDLSAAVGLVQLKKLDKNNSHRRKIAGIYKKRMKKLGIGIIDPSEGVVPSYYKFPIFLPEEIAAKKHYFLSALAAENSNIDQFNSSPLTKVDFLKQIALRENFRQKFFEKDYPIAQKVDKTIAVLPIQSNIPLLRINQICDAVEKVITYGNWK